MKEDNLNKNTQNQSLDESGYKVKLDYMITNITSVYDIDKIDMSGCHVSTVM